MDLDSFKVIFWRLIIFQKAISFLSWFSWSTHIIHIWKSAQKTFLLENIVHCSLKTRDTIRHSRRQNAELIQATKPFESSILPLQLFQGYLMISTLQIISGENSILKQLINHVFNTRQWVCIQLCKQIYCLHIIYAHPFLLMFTFHRNNLGRPR